MDDSRFGARVGSDANEGTNDSVGVSDADIRLALEMNDRASRGEYILQFERPVDRKVMESTIKAFAAQLASNNSPNLGMVFGQLGISQDKAEQLELHNQKIILASLEAEQAIQQVLQARREYDKRVKALLSDDGYAAYRDYEAFQPALKEYDALEKHATQNNVPLDPAYQQQVLDLIQQAGAYTRTSWHGPYDDLPGVAVGNEMITKRLGDQIAQINQTFESLKRSATEAGISQGYIDVLSAYYGNVIQEKQRTIANLNSPPEAAK